MKCIYIFIALVIFARLYVLLFCVGLKEYIGANPALTFESSTVVVQSKTSGVSTSSNELEDAIGDEFYDAIGTDSSSSDEDSDDEVSPKQVCSFSCSIKSRAIVPETVWFNYLAFEPFMCSFNSLITSDRTQRSS